MLNSTVLQQQRENDLLDDAYALGQEQGEQAAKGLCYDPNPYRRGSSEWQEWWMGWHAGQERDYVN